jgi:hypothetical protein
MVFAFADGAAVTRCRRIRQVLAATVLLIAAGCAAAPAGAPGAPGTDAGRTADRGVPGFDTRDYPGDAAMRSWRSASPYRWVGYYLPAPCYTGTTWTGRRATLREMGWGFAVLFVGEQDWAAMRAVAGDTVSAAVENPRCTRANLTAAHGVEHAAAAAAAAVADGFPASTVIFLDVERVERVSADLATYVRAWTGTLLDGGRYVPGLYAHDHNVPDLIAVLAEEFQRRQRRDMPALWVAKQSGFDMRRSPAESGYPIASAWQGIFNVREAWGGVELLIDVNVADSADPSRGR